LSDFSEEAFIIVQLQAISITQEVSFPQSRKLSGDGAAGMTKKESLNLGNYHLLVPEKRNISQKSHKMEHFFHRVRQIPSDWLTLKLI